MMTSNAALLQGRSPSKGLWARPECRSSSVPTDPNVTPSVTGRVLGIPIMRHIFVAIAALSLSGCADVPVAPDRLAAPAQANRSSGDRDDIEVSVDAALGRAHVAPVAMTRQSDGSLLWELRTPRDEPGTLQVWQTPGTEEGAPVDVRIECRVGRFGDPDKERLIIDSVAQRLEQLRGRDYYRITWR